MLGCLYNDNVIPTYEAERFITDCLVVAGAAKQNANDQAKLMVHADINGYRQGGVQNLEFCVDKLLEGVMDGISLPEIEKENPCTAVVNGKNAMGATVGKFCMELAIKKAKKIGIGWVVAKNCNYNGAEDWYCRMATNEGLVGMALSNSPPVVAPARGKTAALGSNPIGFAAPLGGSDCFVADFSTSTVSQDKIVEKKQLDEEIPGGWALDMDGKITNDPDAALSGTLLPIGGVDETGGYKGTALGLIVETLCGIMSGSNFSTRIKKNPIQPIDLGQCYVAVNPEMFAGDFQKRMSSLLNIVKKSTPIDPSKPVLLPGEPEQEKLLDCQRLGGIRYGQSELDACAKLSAKLAVSPITNVHGLPVTPFGFGGKICGAKCSKK